MKKIAAIFTVFLVLVVFGCTSTKSLPAQSKPIDTGLQVSYDENGKPVSKNDLYFVDITELNDYIGFCNATDSDINIYYELGGKWNTICVINKNDSMLISKSSFKGSSFICIEYIGIEHIPFTIRIDKVVFSNVIIGYPNPEWNGSSFEELVSQVINENIYDSNTKFLIQSISTSKPNSAGGVDIAIDFWNLSEKTIKYVFFTLEPYNRVDDVTLSTINGKSEVIVQMVDFIEKNHFYSASWENVWYNNSIEYFKIKNIRIVYKDNSEVSINDNELQNITNINPISCQIYNDDLFSIVLSYNDGRIYYNVFSDFEFDEFKILFETNPKTFYSKSYKNIEIAFTNLMKPNNVLERKGIRAVDPNNLTKLLYEINRITVNYKLRYEEEKVIEIKDVDTISRVKNYAYVVVKLGLK